MQKTLLSLGLIFFALTLSSPALACAGGQEFTKEAGRYTIDVTDDSYTIEPGQAVHFDFGLYQKSDETYGEPVGAKFSNVLVMLSHGGEKILEKNVPMDKNRELTGIDQIFPDENADDTISVRYMNGPNVLAEGSFPLRIGSGDFKSFPMIAAAGVTLLLVLGIAAIFHAQRA